MLNEDYKDMLLALSDEKVRIVKSVLCKGTQIKGREAVV